MKLLQLAREIHAPIDPVWSIVRDFGGVDRWIAELRCTVEGSGIGAVRTIVYPDGRTVRERLEAFDEARRLVGYSMVTGGVFHLPNLVCTIQLHQGHTADYTIVDWTAAAARDDGIDRAELLAAFASRLMTRTEALRQAAQPN